MRRFVAVGALLVAGFAVLVMVLLRGVDKPTAAIATLCPAGLHVERYRGARVCVPEIEGPEHLRKVADVRRLRETGGMRGVRPGAFAAAVRQRERLKAKAAQRLVPGSGGTWTPQGSGPLLANDASYDVSKEGIPLINGRINDFAYDDGHHRVYAAVSYGGVWASDDLGRSWVSVGDSLPTQIVASVGYTPAGGGTVIALTGENNNGGNSFAGLGAYRTTDHGKTWQRSKGVPTGTIGFKVAVDPTDPKVVYLATGFGLYRSDDAGVSFMNVDLPTGDCHGEAFARKDCYLANIVSDVVVQAPDSFGHKGGAVLAVVGWRAGASPYRDGKPQAPGNGLYASDSGIPGSFKRLDGTGFAPQNRIGRVEMGVATGPKQNHGYVYAEVQDAQLFRGGVAVIDVPDQIKAQNVYRPTYFNGIYVSADFGKTWTQMMSTLDVDKPNSGSALVPVGAVPVVGSYLPGIQAWYNEWVAVDPTLQIGDGIPTRMSFGLEEVWQNVGTGTPLTGRTDFHVIGRYYAGEVCQLGLVPTVPGLVPCPTDPQPTTTTTHPDQHGAVWIPDGKGGVTLLVGNDGGAFAQHAAPAEQMDNTKWGEGRNEDMHTLLPYDAVMAKDGTITAGLQDNGQLKITSRGRQSEIYGGDAFYSAIDPDNSDVIYEEYVGGVMRLTKDGGHTWRSISTSDEVNGNGALFAAPFMMDPLNANHIVAGGARVMETTAGPETSSADQADLASSPATTAGYDPNGPQWASVFDLGTNAGGDQFQMSSLDVRGDDVYVGACGKCDVLSGGTGTFHNELATNVGGDAPPKAGAPAGWHLAKAAGLPERIINGVAMDPSDPRTVYVVLGAYSRRWLPPGSMGEDASKVGSGHVFKSTDAGASFADITGELPDASALSVLVHGNQVVVSTDVGVFTSPTKDGKAWTPLGSSLPNAPVVAMHITPRDANELIAAAYGRGVYTYNFADPSTAGCVDVSKPLARVTRKLGRGKGGRVILRGRASDHGCLRNGKGKVKKVRVALARVGGKRCRFVTHAGHLGKATSCKRPRYLRPKGIARWTLTLRHRPPSGNYRVFVQAIDSAGNTRAKSVRLKI